MASYVLVHGAWFGGWCWSGIGKRLRAAGHDVFAPTLTGVGERSHLSGATVNLSTHVTDIGNLLRWEGLRDAVLVGHSYGGMVITGVADADPERVAALVYLDAFVPVDGKAAFDYLDEPTRNYFVRSAAKHGGYAMPPPRIDGFNLRDRALLPALGEKLTLHPLASWREAIALGGAHEQVARRAYGWANDYPRSPFTAFYERLRETPGWETRELDSGHLVMYDAPDAVTELLLAQG